MSDFYMVMDRFLGTSIEFRTQAEADAYEAWMSVFYKAIDPAKVEEFAKPPEHPAKAEVKA
jgi:hypothetical protein